ncbi:MAG: protoporphyrinogen oxidase, partial [Actinomycetota bacterium]
RELGLEDRLQGADMARRKVFVLFRGRLIEMPEGLAMMVPSRIAPMIRTRLLSPLGKLRLALDWILPSSQAEHDESLAAFISRRLGRQAYERLIEPLMSGIYAGDGERLSLLSTFPFLRDWERRYSSVARGALRQAQTHSVRSDSAPRGSIFLTPMGGLGEIVESLLVRLKRADLRLNTAVTRIDRVDRGYIVGTASGEMLAAQAVVLAAPSYAAAEMLRVLDPRLAELLDGVEYVSTATVSLAFRAEDLPRPLDGHGYVIPRVEGRRALACTWTSTKFPHRAPPGHALLRVFIGRAGQMDDPEMDEASLAEVARREVAETLGIRSEPLLVRVARWPRSMPQYNLGHPGRLGEIGDRLELLPGLHLAGAAYAGIGIPDCIRSGEEAARAALAPARSEAVQPTDVPLEVNR